MTSAVAVMASPREACITLPLLWCLASLVLPTRVSGVVLLTTTTQSSGSDPDPPTIPGWRRHAGTGNTGLDPVRKHISADARGKRRRVPEGLQPLSALGEGVTSQDQSTPTSAVARDAIYDDATGSGSGYSSPGVTKVKVTEAESESAGLDIMDLARRNISDGDPVGYSVNQNGKSKDVTSLPSAVEEDTNRNISEIETDLAPVRHRHPASQAAPLSGSRSLSDEEKLLHKLFGEYNPSARPVMDSSDTVSVGIMFSLMHIKDLDIRSQIFTTTGLLILVWTDERLTWLPEDHNNMTEIIIEAKALWRPEFAVINGAENIYEEYDQFRAVINHTGEVHWEPGGVFKTMCEIDITFYPFDEQICALTFGAWSYHTQKMNLTSLDTVVNLDSYKINGEWDIYHTDAYREEFAYTCCPNEPYAYVKFNVYLRRRHVFYILNVILPSIMTSVLLLSIFFCTPGQKVQIGVVVLLSFRIFLLNVAGNIPKTSDHIPLLGIYLTCTMAITTLSMVLTVFVLNLHYINDRPVPGWTRRLVFVYLAKLLGMCTSANQFIAENEAQRKTRFKTRQSHPGSVSFFRRSYTGVQVDGGGDETAAIMEMQTRTPQSMSGTHNGGGGGGTGGAPGGDGFQQQSSFTTGFGLSNHHQVSPNPAKPGQGHPENPFPVTGFKTPDSYAGVGTYPESQENKDGGDKPDYSKDWKKMAEIFDRLFFWLFLFAIATTTLVLFHPLTRVVMSGQETPGHT